MNLRKIEEAIIEHYIMYVERSKRKGHVVKPFDEWLANRRPHLNKAE
jgi:hypothetical protein